MINKPLRYLLYTVGILIIAAGTLFLYTNEAKAPILPATPQVSPTASTSPVANTISEPRGQSVSLSIEGLFTDRTVSITSGESMVAMLQQVDAVEPAMKLSIQTYESLGTLITGMGGLQNGTDKKYWKYRVNGVEPQIGASGYILKPGDKVEWYFTAK